MEFTRQTAQAFQAEDTACDGALDLESTFQRVVNHALLPKKQGKKNEAVKIRLQKDEGWRALAGWKNAKQSAVSGVEGAQQRMAVADVTKIVENGL